MSSKPKVGQLLNCEDGTALVVAEGCTPLDGLLDMLEEGYGCPRFAADNPAILAALSRVKVETWRYCTKPWCEGEGIDWEDYNGYWSANGDGARTIVVAWFDGDAYRLGDEAVCAEAPLAAANLVGGSR